MDSYDWYTKGEFIIITLGDREVLRIRKHEIEREG